MRWISLFIIGMVVSFVLVGCTNSSDTKPTKQTISHDVVEPPSPPLNDLEKTAISFVEAAYIHKNFEKAKEMADWESPQISEGMLLFSTIKPGKIKIASEIEIRGFRTVYLFLPYPINNENASVLRIELLKRNGKLLIFGHSFEEGVSVYRDFNEFQSSQYWDNKGRRYEWKDAELR